MEKQPLAQNHRQWLLDQMALWRRENLVTEEQKHAILDLYQTQQQSAARQQSIAIFVLLGVAAFLVGLAVLLLIGYNWDDLPAPIKLILVVGAVLGTYAVAWHLRYRRDARTASELVFFLGAILYGAAIWLIAQIFHLNAHYPDGYWWWAVGIFPIALCLDTVLLHLLVTAILAAWAGTEILAFPGMGLWFFGRLEMLPNGCYTLPLFAFLGLIWAYHKNSRATVGLYVPLIVWWVVLQPFSWHFRENPVFFIGGIGAILLILAETHEEGSPLAIPYRFYGALVCMGVLAALSFYQFQQNAMRLESPARFFLPTLLVTLCAGAAAVAAVITQARRNAHEDYTRPVYAFAVRQWLPLMMVALMFALPVWHLIAHSANGNASPGTALLPTILANLAMLALAFWLLQVGLREERGFPFAAAVLYFLLWAVMRYIDLFSEAGGMLGASCMFFVAGAFIFGGAMFWQRQRKQHEGSQP